MKNIFIPSLFAAMIFIAGTGCIKDKGFENNEYGINDPDNSPAGIGFPEAVNVINIKGVNFVTTPQTINDPLVNLESGKPAPKDLHITLVANPSLVAAYNSDPNNSPLTALAANLYNIPTLKITIPAGKTFGSIAINIPNASLLSTSETYGFGFSIATIDEPGYIIASNLKNILVAINVKNRYDGVYKLKVRMTAPNNDRPTVNVATTWSWGGNISMITTGANTVKLFDDWGYGIYIHPIQTNTGGYSGFGSTEPKFTFDLTTNKLTAASNDFVNPPNGRAFAKNPDPAFANDGWNSSTKNITANIIMTQPGFGPLLIADTLTYVGAR